MPVTARTTIQARHDLWVQIRCDVAAVRWNFIRKVPEHAVCILDVLADGHPVRFGRFADVRYGQSRRFWPIQARSAFHPIVTVERTSRNVRNVPVADSSGYSIRSSAIAWALRRPSG